MTDPRPAWCSSPEDEAYVHLFRPLKSNHGEALSMTAYCGKAFRSRTRIDAVDPRERIPCPTCYVRRDDR